MYELVEKPPLKYHLQRQQPLQMKHVTRTVRKMLHDDEGSSEIESAYKPSSYSR